MCAGNAAGTSSHENQCSIAGPGDEGTDFCEPHRAASSMWLITRIDVGEARNVSVSFPRTAESWARKGVWDRGLQGQNLGGMEEQEKPAH